MASPGTAERTSISVRNVLWGVGLALVVGLHAQLFLTMVWRQSFQFQGVRYYTLGDDAMISMRYAHNLAMGHGLVWNPGERVEGITNLAWTVIMAGIHALGPPLAEAGLYVQVANLLLQAVLIAYMGIVVRRTSGPLAGLLAAVLVAANGALLCWGTQGFETSLQALLCALALIPLTMSADARRDTRFPLSMALLGLAFVVRPDSIVFIALWLGVGAWWTRLHLMKARSFLWGCMAAGLGVAVVLAFQRLYYGAWLPNTYFLKATGGAAQYARGVDYLVTFAFRDLFHVGLLVGPLLLAARRWRGGESAATSVPLALTVLGWLAYVVKVGGDPFPFGRFMIPLVPLLAAATARFVVSALWPDDAAAARRAGLLAPGRAAGVLVAALLLPYFAGLAGVAGQVGRRSGATIESVLLALALNRANLPPDATVAVHLAGTLPYFMPDRRFHDLLGKSDRHIARTAAHPGPPGHNKWDFTYSLDTIRPDLVVTSAPYAGASDAEMARRAAAGRDYAFHPALWVHPTFREVYRGHRLELQIGGMPIGQFFWVYARGDRAEAFRAATTASAPQ